MPEINYAAYCDHTVLKAFTTQAVVKEFCDEAKKYKVAAVCVNPVHVPFVREQLKGTGIKTCTVIGFPLGANTPEVKAFEAADAVKNGAEELDMVINVGAVRDGNTDLVLRDIKGVVAAAGGATVKVIIETCYLTDEEKITAARLCDEAGAQFVKTSTGFGTRGASVHDLELIRQSVRDSMKIKASSGILARADADTLIKAGAHRLGLSRSVQVIENDPDADSATTRTKTPVG